MINQITVAKLPKAAHKLQLYKPESLKPRETAIEMALNSIRTWYGGRFPDIARKKIERALSELVKLWPYRPWNKSVFRAFALKPNIVKRLKEGKDYLVKTGVHPIQSWTTSSSNAIKFGVGTYGYESNFGVAQLKSKGLELSNFDWLSSVALALSNKIYKDLDFYREAEDLVERLDILLIEDEVIMKLPEKSRVAFVFINSSEERPFRSVASADEIEDAEEVEDEDEDDAEPLEVSK